MTSTATVQKRSADQVGSADSKQKLYVVAFASLGLLIAVQFRHLFTPLSPGAETSAAQTATTAEGAFDDAAGSPAAPETNVE